MRKEVENIWVEFHQELKGYITKKVGNTNDADDILQNAFIKVIQNIDKVNGARNRRQYLYAIVKNSTTDHYRNLEVKEEEIKEQQIFIEKEEETINRIIAECCIEQMIQKLPPKYKEALLLSEIQKIPQKELAAKLNISYSGAKSRVQRGREKLKQMLLDCCDLHCDSYGNLKPGEKDNFNC